MEDYLDAFVQESEEHITTLNNALLDLESDPGDQAAMDQIFRTAHTLKGNCGAMGFGDASDLAHAMEDLLDAMRDGEVPVTPDTMDLVFEGVDALEAMLDDVAETGEPQSDPAALIDDLRSAIEDADPAEDAAAVTAPADDAVDELLADVEEPTDADRDVYTVRVDVEAADADAGVEVVEGLEDAFEVLAAQPPADRIADGDFEGTVDVALAATVGREDIRAALDAIGPVTGVAVTDVTARFRDEPTVVPETGDEEVDAILAEVDEFDLAEAEAESNEILDLEGGGTFDDLDLDLDDDEPAETAATATGDEEVDAILEEVEEFDDLESAGDVLADDVAVDDADDMDANEQFKALKEEVEPVGFDELEAELDELEFEGVSPEEEVGFDELVGDAAGAEADAAAAGVADAAAVPAAEPPEPAAELEPEDARTAELDRIQSVRVDVDDIDELYGFIEELVTNRIRLRRAVEEGDLQGAGDELDDLETLTSRLQDTVMDIRLVPLSAVAGNLPRVVRDLARSQGKEVDFRIEGQSVELDRSILDAMRDPLLHIVRNAVDHGIEPPETREDVGKATEGTVVLRARRSRDRVTISVSDDGRGMDAAVIRSEAVDQGLLSRSEVDDLTDQEAYELVFEPGFSTSEEVTEYSGRGVGMDVVKSTVSDLDGSVDIRSEPGEGTTVELTLPVTVAIVNVLFVESGGEEYGIPIENVDEITRIDAARTVDGQEVLTHDDDVYPLIRLGDALSVPGETTNGRGKVVRIDGDVRQVALHCDDVRAQEEVVVKPFDGLLAGIPGMSGATVLGEGDVVTILDVETL